MTHLNALELRLSNERIRLSNAKTKEERELRSVWVKQIEKEISDEIAFLGHSNKSADISDSDLLAELGL